jgi:peptidoglycan/LPS O-acetylase OafA/YrhL
MAAAPKPYITTLTPLRGIAALLVVAYHSNRGFAPIAPITATSLFANGWLWVDFFFMLSGFILCYTYEESFTGSVTRASYAKYIGARIARIYPLHLMSTLWMFAISIAILRVATSVTGWAAGMLRPTALPACLLLVQSIHVYDEPPLNPPAWSLSTEWWVYLVFPFLVPVFYRLQRGGKVAAALAVIGLYLALRYVVGAWSFGVPTIAVTADFGLVRCLIGFACGMLLHKLYRDRTGYRLLRTNAAFLVGLFGAVAAMHFDAMDIAIVAFFPLVILAAAHNGGLVKRGLDTRVLQRLGTWSFSIYMIHVPIMSLLLLHMVNQNPALLSGVTTGAPTTPSYGFGAIAAATLILVTVGLSALTYRFIEVPGRNLLNRMFKTQRQTPMVGTAKI